MNSPILTIVFFLLIITLVVVSHEFGHYLIARINGIKVNEFSIGFGPAIFKKKGKVTDFVIRLLPFGGACIFEGEDGKYSEGEDKADDLPRRALMTHLSGPASLQCLQVPFLISYWPI